jgi:hypothetical protein
MPPAALTVPCIIPHHTHTHHNHTHTSDKELVQDFQTTMARYVTERKIAVREHVTEGLEHAGRAFIEVCGAMPGVATAGAAVRRPAD